MFRYNKVMAHLEINEPGIYFGPRDNVFKQWIIDLFTTAQIPQVYIDILIDDQSMAIYDQVFTSSDVNGKDNYEVYELLGDKTIGKFMIWYFSDRFPFLRSKEGVKIISRLLLLHGSKNVLSELSTELGLPQFITASNTARTHMMADLAEDTFEAFIGATETILDTRVIFGIGYTYMYKFLKSIYDKRNVSLEYTDLFDAKTRLKELFDMDDRLTSLKYNLQQNADAKDLDHRVYSNITASINGRQTKLASGHGQTKAIAEQMAAEQGINLLKTRYGIEKKVPAYYTALISDSGPAEVNRDTFAKKLIDRTTGSMRDINEVYTVKGKTLVEKTYKGTLLHRYTRQRNLSGIKLAIQFRADPNVVDSYDLTATDIALMGTYNPVFMKSVLNLFAGTVNKLVIHKYIYDRYYPRYMSGQDGQYFESLNKHIQLI